MHVREDGRKPPLENTSCTTSQALKAEGRLLGQTLKYLRTIPGETHVVRPSLKPEPGLEKVQRRDADVKRCRRGTWGEGKCVSQQQELKG